MYIVAKQKNFFINTPDDCQHLSPINCLHDQLSGHVANKTYNVKETTRRINTLVFTTEELYMYSVRASDQCNGGQRFDSCLGL